MLGAASGLANGQYAKINAMLQRLEERRGLNQDLASENFEDRKFVLLKDFEDHVERQFITVKGTAATYVEVFDDKQTGQISSNVFSGDMQRMSDSMLSFRFDKLEGETVALPVAKNFILQKQKKILYLVDVNTKERWIDEAALGKKNK